MSIRARHALDKAIRSNSRKQHNQRDRRCDNAGNNRTDMSYAVVQARSHEFDPLVPDGVVENRSYPIPGSIDQQISSGLHLDTSDVEMSIVHDAAGYAQSLLDALDTSPIKSRPESPIPSQSDESLRSYRPERPLRRPRGGSDVYDFVGSDDEMVTPQRRPSLVITLRFEHHRNYMKHLPPKKAPTADMTSRPKAPDPPMGTITQHSTSSDRTRAINGPPTSAKKPMNDDRGTLIPRKTLKSKMNVSGLSSIALRAMGARCGRPEQPHETEALDKSEEVDKYQVQTLSRTPSRMSVTSNASSEFSFDSDDEDDETYTPPKVMRNKRIALKTVTTSTSDSRVARKRQSKPKRRNTNQPSLSTRKLPCSEASPDIEALANATLLQAALQDRGGSPNGAFEERRYQELSLPSPAKSQSEIMISATPIGTENLERRGQEHTAICGNELSPQAEKDLTRAGKGGAHKITERNKKFKSINHSGSDPRLYGKRSSESLIIIPDESPPPSEQRPPFTPSSPRQDHTTSFAEFGSRECKYSSERNLAAGEHQHSTDSDRKRKRSPRTLSEAALEQDLRDSVVRSTMLPPGTPEIVRSAGVLPETHNDASDRDTEFRRVTSSWSEDTTTTAIPLNLGELSYRGERNEPAVLSLPCNEEWTVSGENIFTMPNVDASQSPNKNAFLRSEQGRTYPPKAIRGNGLGQTSKVLCSPIDRSNIPMPASGSPGKASSPHHIPNVQADIGVAWFILVAKPTGGQVKIRLSGLTLDNMTLNSIFEHAEAKVPTGIEIYTISLMIRSYEHDKQVPEWAEIVQRNDDIGFERFKMEFLDSIREYAEQGVKQYRILIKVNPDLERRVDQ